MGWVISDSSTLLHLSKINQLDLLKKLYGQLAVPPAVWREVVEQGAGRGGAAEVSEAHDLGWLVVLAPVDKSLIQLLKRDLDDGESEAIALAIEQHADLILLDESEARRIAELYHLFKTGAVGILIKAKQLGLIKTLRNELDQLRKGGGFWISEELYHRALRAAGEDYS